MAVLEHILEWVYNKFWYLLPDWYWIVTFTTPWLSPMIWRAKSIPKAMKFHLLIIIFVGLADLGGIVCLLFPDIGIKGVICDKSNTAIRIEGATVAIESLEFDTEVQGQSNSQGKFSVPFPRVHLGEAKLKITDPKEEYVLRDRDCNLKEKKFLRIFMQPVVADYRIVFNQPPTHIYSSRFLNVTAIFKEKKGTGTVRIPCPKENVALLIDENTKEYTEKNDSSTDRVTWKESLDNYDLKAHEVRVITRYLNARREKKALSNSTYFTPVRHYSFENLEHWRPSESDEKTDWKPSRMRGIKGKLRPGDSGNVLLLCESIRWGPIALDFKARTFNQDFVNVVIKFGENYRIIIGDGDRKTIRVQRGRHSGKIWVSLDKPPRPLNTRIDPKDWIDIKVEFDPEYQHDKSQFRIELVNALIPHVREVLFRREKIPERWHLIGIGHLNPSVPKTDQDTECSSVEFRDFHIYGILKRPSEAGH